jgi:recombination protein RecR
MTPAFEEVQQRLKTLPGLGFRSAERIALHLLVERREELEPLVRALQEAAERLGPCPRCGNLCEGELCAVCADPGRRGEVICVVEHVPDLMALERAGVYRGVYHVLHGRLSPLHGIGPEQLNLATLGARLRAEPVAELILALGNDIEGEATCHYIRESLPAATAIRISRIGFGLPSGSGITYADPGTLRSALEARRPW